MDIRNAAFYVGVVGLAALECIEWPLALVFVASKALADQHHSQLLRQIGQGTEQAEGLTDE